MDDSNAELFRSEQADLLFDLQNLPRNRYQEIIRCDCLRLSPFFFQCGSKGQ